METRTMRRALLLIGILPVAFAGGGRRAEAWDMVVVAGSDYFESQPGTSLNLGGSIGTVDLRGLPIGPGDTDTIIQRQADATINGAAIPIQITALSLESAAPVNIGGSFFDVFVTLDPNHLADDTGSMTISGSTSGGTFTSSLNVWFDAHFVPTGGGTPPADLVEDLALTNSGSNWRPTPPAGAIVVNGPLGDQNANLHSGLAANEVDFFAGVIDVTNPGGGQQFVDPASAPEPASWLMAGEMLIVFGTVCGYKRMKRTTVVS